MSIDSEKSDRKVDNENSTQKGSSTQSAEAGERVMNRSNTSVSEKPIPQVILEKALQGAVPQYFALSDVDGWHTVQWMHHPRLAALQFSDGSVVYVAETASQVITHEVAMKEHHGGDRQLTVTMTGGEELTPEDFKPSPEEEEEARRDAEHMAGLLAERRAKREE